MFVSHVLYSGITKRSTISPSGKNLTCLKEDFISMIAPALRQCLLWTPELTDCTLWSTHSRGPALFSKNAILSRPSCEFYVINAPCETYNPLSCIYCCLKKIKCEKQPTESFNTTYRLKYSVCHFHTLRCHCFLRWIGRYGFCNCILAMESKINEPAVTWTDFSITHLSVILLIITRYMMKWAIPSQ